MFGKKNVKIEPKIEENKLPEENEISPRLEVSDESTETHPDIISVKEEEVQTTSEKDEEEEEEVETVERSEEQEVEAPERDGEEEAVEMDTDEDAIRTLSDESFRTAIIEKDSEIICLKNENAVSKKFLKNFRNLIYGISTDVFKKIFLYTLNKFSFDYVHSKKFFVFLIILLRLTLFIFYH